MRKNGLKRVTKTVEFSIVLCIQEQVKTLFSDCCLTVTRPSIQVAIILWGEEGGVLSSSFVPYAMVLPRKGLTDNKYSNRCGIFTTVGY